MREILFRGVSTDSVEWVEGWFEMYPYSRWPLKATIVPAEEAKEGYFHHVEVIPETVGQYTGLTDKNGKKIFEGDIIEWDELEWGSKHREVVTWDYTLLAMRKYDWGEWCEVIGNIHDNPYLLKGGAVDG